MPWPVDLRPSFSGLRSLTHAFSTTKMHDSAPRVSIVGPESERQTQLAKALEAAGCTVDQLTSMEELPRLANPGTNAVVIDFNAVDPGKLAAALCPGTASPNPSQPPGEPAASRTPESLRKLAHDLRTPLNAILGWAQLLKFGDLDDAMRQEALDTIERSAKAQAEMISNMLDLPPS